MRYLRCWFGLLVFLSACGGPSEPKDLKATITPATASIPVNSTLNLQASATGQTAPPGVGWWMDEAKGSPTALYCGLDYKDPTPSETDCPCGYIKYDTHGRGVPANATYHAPSVPGVCHPIAQVMQFDGYFLQAAAQARAEITVTAP